MDLSSCLYGCSFDEKSSWETQKRIFYLKYWWGCFGSIKKPILFETSLKFGPIFSYTLLYFSFSSHPFYNYITGIRQNEQTITYSFFLDPQGSWWNPSILGTISIKNHWALWGLIPSWWRNGTQKSFDSPPAIFLVICNSSAYLGYESESIDCWCLLADGCRGLFGDVQEKQGIVRPRSNEVIVHISWEGG